MKRPRSSDDLDNYKDSNPARSSRSSYHNLNTSRKTGGFSPSNFSGRYDRDPDDSRDSSRSVRKRSDHDFDAVDRRKGLGLGFDRYGGGREGHNGNNGGGIGDRGNLIHRSESFCGGSSRGREFPKGFRSDRERSRREGSVSVSWRRLGGGGKEFEESSREIGSNRGKESSRASPKGLKREGKSPTWSRDSGSEHLRGGIGPGVFGRGGSGRDDGRVKSSNSKSRSSPSWSKDSESERSVEVGKKSGEVEVKSLEVEEKNVVEVEGKCEDSGSSSEMEEGEVERERESVGGGAGGNGGGDEDMERQVDVELDACGKEEGGETQTSDQASKEGRERDISDREDKGKEVDGEPKGEENGNGGSLARKDEVEDLDGVGVNKDSEGVKELRSDKEGTKDVVFEKSMSLKEESKLGKGFDLEAKMENAEAPGEEVMAERRGADLNLDIVTASASQNLKDKGKSVAVSPTCVPDSAKDGLWVERESRNVASFKDREHDMEGPSSRGFELFTSSPVRRMETAEELGISKPKEEKMALEPLDLSLSLPNVLLPIGANRDTFQAPGSPSQGRSVQSFSTFRTNSDGFTASMSFSGSQSFFHNPSCSLTHNSLDVDNYEQSVHSRPIFQGLDQGNSQNDTNTKDVPLYQKILANGNGSLMQSQALLGVSNGQGLQGSSKIPNKPERQLSFHKQLSSGQARNHDDTRSPAQSVGSHDIGSSYTFEKKRAMREKHGGSLHRSGSQREQEQLLIGGPEFMESIIGKIVSDPIYVMARKFHEMPGQSASLLKESIREFMLSADKHGQVSAFQSALKNRSDLTLEMLLQSHRVQLEILVALKTGLKEYLQLDGSISSSDLAEIFLNLRCRNLACRNPLPVDECDCKVCAKKSGFCSACMCLVCSKFDLASNTCSWIGCDVCLHWCHADCALRESFIRNGRSASGVQGAPEMQFHCVACDHPSEMFGFVKEVFQNFAKEWSAETFFKELEYVRRIFSASKDVRGRRLHEIADQMLTKLANKSNLHEVYSCTMGFFNESDSTKFDASKFSDISTFSGKEPQENVSNGVVVAGTSHDPSWFKSVYTEKAPQLERSASLLPTFHTDLPEKLPGESKSHRSVMKEPIFQELESIVRIKQAEAEMFQARADDARREAEGLRRIAAAKSEKIEEEYSSRVRKLRIVDAEDMRKQKLEEFQALERAHREYFSMKMRMEADIKDLLLKMDATKKNLAM